MSVCFCRELLQSYISGTLCFESTRHLDSRAWTYTSWSKKPCNKPCTCSNSNLRKIQLLTAFQWLAYRVVILDESLTKKGQKERNLNRSLVLGSHIKGKITWEPHVSFWKHNNYLHRHRRLFQWRSSVQPEETRLGLPWASCTGAGAFLGIEKSEKDINQATQAIEQITKNHWFPAHCCPITFFKFMHTSSKESEKKWLSFHKDTVPNNHPESKRICWATLQLNFIIAFQFTRELCHSFSYHITTLWRGYQSIASKTKLSNIAPLKVEWESNHKL